MLFKSFTAPFAGRVGAPGEPGDIGEAGMPGRNGYVGILGPQGPPGDKGACDCPAPRFPPGYFEASTPAADQRYINRYRPLLVHLMRERYLRDVELKRQRRT